MARPHKDQLRALTDEESQWLLKLSQSRMAPASHVQRARLLLEIAAGKTYMDACRITGRLSSDKVGELVTRFNQEGLAAIRLRHGGGPPVSIGPEQRALILSEARRQPTAEQDDTATWSVTLLRRALNKKGLKVSRDTVWTVLREAGFTWQRDRTWCDTGRSRRKRERGVALVVDPDTEAKKGIDRSRVSGR
jgi:transposase